MSTKIAPKAVPKLGRPVSLAPADRKQVLPVRMGPVDRANILRVRDVLGASNDSEAIRMALQFAVDHAPT
jgi:hypothetical protein